MAGVGINKGNSRIFCGVWAGAAAPGKVQTLGMEGNERPRISKDSLGFQGIEFPRGP